MMKVKSLLVQLLTNRLDNLEAITEKQWEKLILVARYTGVLSRIGGLLKEGNNWQRVPGFAQRHLQAAEAYANRQAQQVQHEAKVLSDLLKREGLQRFAFLKGAAYVLCDAPAAMGRTFSDIDLVVEKDKIEQVEQKLVLYGWFQDKSSDYDQRYYRRWAHEIPPLRHNKRGTVLDLHHNLLPPVSGRAPDMQSFWDGLVPCKQGGFVFSPAGQTLHSLVHLFFQEEYSHGFRDLSDLHLLFSQHGKNQEFWLELLTLAKRTRFERELFYACRYCQQIFDTPIPQDVQQALSEYAPWTLHLKLMDFMFHKVLAPQHPLVETKRLAIANMMALFRGHWLKMPIHILLFHTVNKAGISLWYWLTGRDASQPETNKQVEP